MKIIRLGPDEVFYRYLTPRWAFVPTSGAGAALDGGRFNRPGSRVQRRLLVTSLLLSKQWICQRALIQTYGQRSGPNGTANGEKLRGSTTRFHHRGTWQILSLKRDIGACCFHLCGTLTVPTWSSSTRIL